MNQAVTFIDAFKQKQLLAKRICYLFFILLWLGFPLAFFISTYIETNNLGVDVLGVERYNERIVSSLKYTLAMFGLLGLLCIPAFIFLKRFFKRYEQVIDVLPNRDIERLRNHVELLAWWEKYLPSFMVKEKVLYVFAGFKTLFIPLDEIQDHLNSTVMVAALMLFG